MTGHVRPRAVRGFRGAASGSLTSGARTYASSVNVGYVDLASEYIYDPGFRRLPILVLMHGYGEDLDDIATPLRHRMARRGWFVLAPGMRGRNGASGARDASGREIQDIIDAVEDVRGGFASVVDPGRVAIVGYSGGGGNALAAIAKAPDYWTAAVAHFGPSDYGWRSDSGWYYTDPSFQAALTTDVGATPSAQPGWWRSRNHADALGYQLALAPRGSGPRLWLYHDADDPTVDVAQSDRVRDVLDAAGLTELYSYGRSTSQDATRYLHGYPEGSYGLEVAEGEWWEAAINADTWAVPASGAALVAGFIRTRRFSVWLGTTTGGANPRLDPVGGTVHVARLRWSGATFDLLPLTGALRYRIDMGALTVTGDTSDPITVTL